MNHRRTTQAVGTALGAGAHRRAAGSERPALGDFAAIDALLERAVSNGSVLGVAAIGATSDGVVYGGAFGKANVETGAPMREDTVFWLLSMTKPFTATAAMQLVEQGRMALDQPAADILPQLAAPKVLEGFDAVGQPILRAAKRQITVRHLLTHTSGYTYSVWSDAITRYEQATGMPDIATCQNAAFTAPLEFEPGERWQYGISIDWVGKLVEQVTGQSLEVYFRENIFEPLGMKDSGFLIGSAQKERLATFANRQSDGSLEPAPFEIPQRPEFFSGGGGAFSTPRDYLAFLQMLLNGGRFNGAHLLKPATVAQMMVNQIGDLCVGETRSTQPAYSNSFDQFPGQTHKWGLSFDINMQPVLNGRAAGSISWGGLLNCYFWLDPMAKVTGALFTQILPFYDDRVVALYADFERGLYRGMAHTER
jgi:CubicO group peptidase (beta-lactamase class C family)